jgi:hypothetical protein
MRKLISDCEASDIHVERGLLLGDQQRGTFRATAAAASNQESQEQARKTGACSVTRLKPTLTPGGLANALDSEISPHVGDLSFPNCGAICEQSSLKKTRLIS